MKKRLSFLIAAILVLAFVLSGCGSDPYKGDYKEISEEQAEEYSDRLSGLDEVISGKSLKTEYSINGKEGSTKVEMSGTTLSDLSDPDNMKAYETMSMKMTTENGTYKVSLKAYTDQKADKTLVEIKASAPGKDDYSFKGQMTNAFEAIQELFGSSEVDIGDVMSMLEEMLGELSELDDTKVYVDGDKIKVVFESTESGATDKGEIYVVANKDDFRCKFSETVSQDSYEYTTKLEVALSADKVSIPTSGYDQTMSMGEFQTTISTYMGY